MKQYRKSALFATLFLAIVSIGIFGFIETSKQESLLTTSTSTAEKFIPDPTRQAMQKNLQNQWLLGKLCNPPCWAGIIPGKTTANEALELLNNLPEVTNVKRYEGNTYGEFDWDWVNVENSGGRLFFDVSNPDEIVETILPSFTGYFDSNMSIGEIIKVYGEPTHIRVTKHGPTDNIHGYEIPVAYEVEFIWLSQGFAGDSGVDEKNTQLNYKMPMYSLAFFPPTLDGYLNYRGNAGRTLQSWHGVDDVLNYLAP
ncbi:hypothetical protein ANAEL_03993 [Anaerolineales bacterium]|nr:hypothetical protein ANAEL_03993 [Anaerolineales bacterium]